MASFGNLNAVASATSSLQSLLPIEDVVRESFTVTTIAADLTRSSEDRNNLNSSVQTFMYLEAPSMSMTDDITDVKDTPKLYDSADTPLSFCN